MKSSTCFLAKVTTGEKGFTLIETMIGLFVFTVGILAVMSMTITASNGLIRSRTSTVEVNRSCLNMEALKNTHFKNDTILTGSTTSPVGTDGETISITDSTNTVIKGARLIQIQNNAIHGVDATGNYTLYFAIPEVI